VLAIETVTGAGGKGANQAAAAARLGLNVSMIGRVGDDTIGSDLIAALQAVGVNVDAVVRTPGVPTGQAHVTVAPNGENMIVVSLGANARLSTEDVAAAMSVLANARATLIQLEIPLSSVATAAELSRGIVVLNPAPAQDLGRDILELVDVLVPNRAELMTLGGVPESTRDVAAVVRSLKLPCDVVVTLGAEGALVVTKGSEWHVPAPNVSAIDSTAAGDAFCAALADGLVRGATLREAAIWAVRVASLTTTRRGAHASLPSRAEILTERRRYAVKRSHV